MYFLIYFLANFTFYPFKLLNVIASALVCSLCLFFVSGSQQQQQEYDNSNNNILTHSFWGLKTVLRQYHILFFFSGRTTYGNLPLWQDGIGIQGRKLHGPCDYHCHVDIDIPLTLSLKLERCNGISFKARRENHGREVKNRYLTLIRYLLPLYTGA